MKTKYQEALDVVLKEIQENSGLRQVWESTMALSFYDLYVTFHKKYKNKVDIHIMSNKAAKNFLDTLIREMEYIPEDLPDDETSEPIHLS